MKLIGYEIPSELKLAVATAFSKAERVGSLDLKRTIASLSMHISARRNHHKQYQTS